MTGNDCNKCIHLNVTEQEQNSKSFSSKCEHICLLSGRRIYHRGKHPCLPIPSDCPNEGQIATPLTKTWNNVKENMKNGRLWNE